MARPHRRNARPAAMALALALASGLAGSRARAEGPPADAPPPPGPAPEAWQPPDRFLAAWLRAGPFLASGLPGARTAPELAMGLGIRPLSFLSLEAEGGWISRDLDGGGGLRSTLASRSVTLGARLHRAFGPLEPSLFAGLALLDSRLSSDVSLGTARGTGLAAGAALDLALAGFSAGLEGRWLGGVSFPRPGQPSLPLDGVALTAALRVYYP